MEKTLKENIELWTLDCDENHILHRIGDSEYPEVRHLTVRAAEADSYEELTNEEREAVLRERELRAEYRRRLAAAIHERYSVDDELALAANIAAGATEERQAEYAAYQQYRAECKARVRGELNFEG